MLVSPDCAARKCTACTGDAWDEVADRLDSCFCRCHTSTVDLLAALQASVDRARDARSTTTDGEKP